MLVVLVEVPELRGFVYNTPVELWEARQLKQVVVKARRIRVDLEEGGAGGGPICDGSRFAREFAFQIQGVKHHLSANLGPE